MQPWSRGTIDMEEMSRDSTGEQDDFNAQLVSLSLLLPHL